MPRASLLGSNLHTNNTRHFGSMAGLAPTSTVRPNITGLSGYKVAAVAANQHRRDGTIIVSNTDALNNGCGLGKNSSNGEQCLKYLRLWIPPVVITSPGDNTLAVDNTPATPVVFTPVSLNFRASIDGEATGDRAGLAVASNADGSIIAIGAYKNDGNGNDSGHVRIYQWNGSSWDQVGSDIDGENGGDESGVVLSISSDGTIVAIGSTRNAGNGNFSGHVRIYKWDGSTWNQLGSDIDGEAAGDESGRPSLNSDGTIVAIGGLKHDSNKGHVRVFQWDGSTWNQLGADIDGEAVNDFSGRSSLNSDGTIIAISAHMNDSTTGNVNNNSGHVRVFQWDGSAWNQVGDDIDGEAAGDNSGRGVSLSSDGTIVAIGGPMNDGGDSNNDGGGHVRVFKWNGSSWDQVGLDIDGSAGGDWSGGSVSLSSNGTILATGAAYSGANGGASGQVRVFHWDGSSWNQVGADIVGEAADHLLGAGIALSNDGSLLVAGAYNYNGGDGRVYTYEIV
tara:strand:+ start:298 stop:1815 length:1518 start_codon:yes stop_codon:yes gene_type:complete